MKNPCAEKFKKLSRGDKLAVVALLHEQRARNAAEKTLLKTTVALDAKRLGIGVSTLERWQDDAIKEGLIKTVYDYGRLGRDAAEQLLAGIEESSVLITNPRELADSTLEALKKRAARHRAIPLRNLHVVDVSISGKIDDSAGRRFCRMAAPLLVEALRPAQCLGVTWGHTLQCVLKACKLRELAPDATVFPLTGEGPADPNLDPASTSSNLVKLIVAQHTRPKRRYTLHRVWSAVPKSLDKTRLVAVMTDSDYEQIFGSKAKGEPGLVNEHMDALVTSVAHEAHPWGMSPDRLLTLFRISQKEINRLAKGDIAGVLLRNDGSKLTAREKANFDNLQAGWIGLRNEHLKQLVKRAAESSGAAPGVCVVAAGKNKAAILLSAIDHGLVSQAIVDRSLLEELRSCLKLSAKRS